MSIYAKYIRISSTIDGVTYAPMKDILYNVKSSRGEMYWRESIVNPWREIIHTDNSAAPPFAE